MRHLALSLIALALLVTAARAGTVVTRDGQTLTGELSLAADALKLTPPQGPARTIALKDVTRADLASDDRLAPVANGAMPGAPRAAKAKVGGYPRHVFVEYFADADMKDLRLARYETWFRFSFSEGGVPDPLVPVHPYLRITTRLVPQVTQDHTFQVDCGGNLRLWIDGKVVLDQWSARAGRQATVTVPLIANKPITVRLDAAMKDNYFSASLNWSGRGGRTPAIAPETTLAPEGFQAPAITARVANHDGETYFRAPASIGFDAVVDPAQTKVAHLDLVNDKGVVLAKAPAANPTAPYHIDWKAPPGGSYHLKVRATDDKGVSGYSDPIDIHIADLGERNTLPDPWASLALGRREQLLPGTASFADGTFKLTKAGGQITEEDDAPQFVFQPVNGDFQFIAHVASLTPGDNLTGALAGIMVRQELEPLERCFAAVIGSGATTLVRRPENWGRTQVNDRQEVAFPWLKIVRLDNRLRAYGSTDGQAWTVLGAERISFPQRTYLGLCTMARSRETPAAATFDHVSLNSGPPALAHRVEGILFKNGSFLAAEVGGMKGGKLNYTRAGQRLSIPDSEVARLVYKAIAAEIADKVPQGQSGALLGSGDFLDGELKEVSHQVTVASVAFGQRTISIRYGDVSAVYVSDAQPPSLPVVITATDGSIYQGKAIRVAADKLSIEDPNLGAVDLPLKDIAQLRMK